MSSTIFSSQRKAHRLAGSVKPYRNGVLGQTQHLTDLSVSEALQDQTQNLALPQRKRSYRLHQVRNVLAARGLLFRASARVDHRVVVVDAHR